MKGFSFKIKSKLKSKKFEDVPNADEEKPCLFEKRQETVKGHTSRGAITSFSSRREKKSTPKNDSANVKKSATRESKADINDKILNAKNRNSEEGTSFGLSSQIFNPNEKPSKVAWQKNDVNGDDQSRKSSLKSFSSKSSRLSTETSSVNSDKQKSQSKNISKNSSKTPEKSNAGFRKKLPFHSKVYPLKKQVSMKDFSTALDYDEKIRVRSHSVGSVDLMEAEKMLEEIKEINDTLEIEVRGKDEEVRMLSATIDQVNQTWENKVNGVIKDLESAQKQNTQLRTILAKETASAKAKSNKPIIKIPVRQPSLNKSPDLSRKVCGVENTDAESVTSPKVASNPMEKKRNRNTFKMATRQFSKTEAVKQHLLEALMTSKPLSQLPPDHLESIVSKMTWKRINKGERLMTEGLMGNRFYVLVEGECCLYKQTPETTADLSNQGRAIRKWEIFGESDIFYDAKRVWSCKCTSQGAVWYITRNEFKTAMKEQDHQRRREEILDIIREVEEFRVFDEQELKDIAKIAKIVQFASGDHILRQGLRSNCVFVLKEGEVTTTKIVDGTETRRSKLLPGELLGNPFSLEPHDQNVIASGEKEIVQCVAISKKYLERFNGHVTGGNDVITIGQIEANLTSHGSDETDGLQSTSSGNTATDSSSSGYSSDHTKVIAHEDANHHKRKYDPTHSNTFLEIKKQLQDKTVEDFNFLKTIGHGAYGKVELSAPKNKDDQVFAIKKLSKYEIVVAENQQNVFNEKNLQMETSCFCPFIASLYTTLKDQRFVYFVMEYCPGGELFSLLAQAKHFNDSMARFYAGCMVEALSFLHRRHILFRDLKPENVVFDKSGYCKLTDFGFAKKVSNNSTMRTYSFCGTPEYMAPETIQNQAQTFSVDLWSLGVFIFEILNGGTPFKNKNPDRLSAIILRGIDPRLEAVKNNKRIGPAAGSLIKALCRIRPEDRLGAGKNGISDVTKHTWFYRLNWNALRKRTLKPPWIPKLNSLLDTSHFHVTGRRAYKYGEARDEFSGWDENF